MALNPSVNDFLESSEDEFEDQMDESTEDLDFSTSIFNGDECLGPEVSDALAKKLMRLFPRRPFRANSKC